MSYAMLASIIIILVGIYVYLKLKIKVIIHANKIDQMTPLDFAEYISHIMTSSGYTIVGDKAKASSPVITARDNSGLIVIRTKRSSKKIGTNDVKKIMKDAIKYKDARMWIITNSYLTNPAYNFAISNNIRIINRRDLYVMIEEYERGKRNN